jgi:hypothetical protein
LDQLQRLRIKVLAGCQTRSASTQAAFAAMDQAIEDVLGPRLIRPAQVKPEATEQPVWPSLTDARGKFLLILDEGGAKRDLYQDQWLRRPMFVNQAASHPAAAVMIVNDPIAGAPAYPAAGE